MSLPSLPTGYMDLAKAATTKDEPINVIGVCVDFLPIAKTRGTDFTITFTLHDPSWVGSIGLKCRFFHKDEKRLPSIKNQGDVVILRSVRLKSYFGSDIILSNSATSWVVLSGTTLAESQCPRLSDVAVERSTSSSDQTAHPSLAELHYARAIAHLEDLQLWPQPPKPTSLQVASVMKENGGEPTQFRSDKYSMIQNIRAPQNERDLVFVNIIGEVRKVFDSNFRIELSVTDYTVNENLYDYRYGDDEDGDVVTGDQYGYLKSSPTLWPGPWGKMTMIVTLWDNHADFARQEVRDNNFVHLRNVQVKFDKSYTKLEGNCRGDRFSNRVNVEVLKPREAAGDERLKALLQRKRDYEQMAKNEQLNFVRDASTIKRKAQVAAPRDVPEGNAKKKQTRKERRKAKQVSANESVTKRINNEVKHNQTLQPNSHVRCQNHDVPLTRIDDILDPTILKRETAKCNEFFLPFQNACYKSRIRVVDYFPDNIADFAAPYRESEYDVLSDQESDDDTDIDMTQNDLKWEWRFFLLVEDVSPCSTIDPEHRQMEVLVADGDAQFLLKQDACDLRNERNAEALARLKENLFVLWGDLQERKEEAQSTSERVSVKPLSRPFECLIKEYGVQVRDEHGKHKSAVEFHRMFRLWGTTVVK